MKVFVQILLSFFILSNASAQIPGLTKFDLSPSTGNSYPLYLTAFNTSNGGKICFFGNDGSGIGWELYTCDGNGSHKPALAIDLNPSGGDCVGQYSNHPTIVYNNKLYFTGNNGLSGPELFVFNGNTMPILLKDLVPGNEGSDPDDYAVLNDQLYFRARDAANGYELWTLDLITTISSRLSDISTGSDSSVNGNIIAFNNKIYFTADSGKGNNELFQYDPLTTIVSMVADIKNGTGGSYPQNLTIVNGKLYFTAEDAAHGRELWSYDGISAPTRVTDIVSGFLQGIPSRVEPIIAALNGNIYINGKDTTSGNYLLYQYNPSSTAAVIAPRIASNSSLDPLWLTPYGGKLYYSAYNDTTGFELWSYDPANGPQLVMDLCPGSTGSNPSQLTVVGNDLYFKANDCIAVGIELFRFNYLEVNVKNVKFDGDVTVYPNPVKDIMYMNIKLNKPEDLRITYTDVTGKIMYEQTIQGSSQQLSIPVNSWAAGTYYYTVYSTQGIRYLTGKTTMVH